MILTTICWNISHMTLHVLEGKFDDKPTYTHYKQLLYFQMGIKTDVGGKGGKYDLFPDNPRLNKTKKLEKLIH